jgi:hypothetical protein
LGIDGNPSRSLFGWGVNLTGLLKTFGKDAIKADVAYGRGIAAYSNDCCFDLGANANLMAQTLSLFDWMAYYDHWWDEQWSTSIGFSDNVQDNGAGQFETEQHRGSSASVNLLWRPVQNFLIGLEGTLGRARQQGRG